MLEVLNKDLIQAVQPLDFEIPAELQHEARKLVANKYILDKAAAEQGGAMLAGDLHGGGYGPAEALPFLYRVLPFMEALTSQKDKIFALVPTSHALGCSWRWRTRHLEPDKALRLAEQLSDTNALLSGELDDAIYFWIKQLGLVAPIEGKNRVDFFREQAIEYIPARITTYDYPAADRIKIYRVKCYAFNQIWAVLDDRWVQQIRHPSWTLPLLAAYGATVGDWSPDFVDPSIVLLAFFERPGPSSALGKEQWSDNTTVDLHTLISREEYMSKRIACSLLDLADAKINSKLWIIAVVGLSIGMMGFIVTPDTWVSAKVAAAFVLGSAMMAGFLPTLAQLITVPRRAVANQRFIPPDFSSEGVPSTACKVARRAG